MKKSSKLLVFAVSGALTAAAAVPAFALEHEFHGMFQLQYDVSNFNGNAFLMDGSEARYSPEGKDKDAPTANFFEQRARLAYIAKANQNVKLMTKFELDYQFWGNSSYTTGRNQGGALGADSVNFETKNVYLDLNSPTLATSAKLGMQPVDDAFKGIFFSADMAGILLSHDYPKASATVGFFRWNDSPDLTFGKNTRDLVLLDGKYKITDSTKVGAAYYFVNSDKVDVSWTLDGSDIEDLNVHVLGLNGETTFGPVTVDGFALYQFGKNQGSNTVVLNNNKDRSAWAANVGARAKVGTGTLRSEFLYVSGDPSETGDTNAFWTPAKGGYSESGFWNNEMIILGRDKNAFTNDSAIVFDANNKNQGVYFGSVGFDQPITDKIAASVNAGFAAAAKVAGDRANYLGTEINGETSYKFTDAVTFSARAGYVFLGGYFNGVAAGGDDPDNPYDVKLIANYSF